MPKKNRISPNLLSKKLLCNPPVAAAVEGFENLLAAGLLEDDDVREAISCDEEFVARYKAIGERVVARHEP